MKASVYAPLMDTEIIGMHAVNITIREFTTGSRAEVIMKRFNEIYDQYVEKNKIENAFTPEFHFVAEDVDRLFVTMHRKTKTSDSIVIGTVLINLVRNHKNDEMLELDIGFVTGGEEEREVKDLSASDMIQYLYYHLKHFGYNGSREIISHTTAYQTLDDLQEHCYRFNVLITNEKITITVNKYGEQFRVMNFMIP